MKEKAQTNEDLLLIRKKRENDRIISLAGNPNVGKSSVFNALTGMHQHTGNWPGKTVSGAQGYFEGARRGYVLVDLPGTYSLLAHSAEEEVARNFLCFGKSDATVVICDATNLERTLALALQIMESTPRVIVGVNLLDEARRKQISLDLPLLEKRLGIPVVGFSAQKKKSLRALTELLDAQDLESAPRCQGQKPRYPSELEKAIAPLLSVLAEFDLKGLDAHWLALRLLERDESLNSEIGSYLGTAFLDSPILQEAIKEVWERLAEGGITQEGLRDLCAAAAVQTAEELCRDVVHYEKKPYSGLDRRLDRILTGRLTGSLLMILLLLLTFFLTITLSNYPSAFLSACGEYLLARLWELLPLLGFPAWLCGLLIDGILKVLFWVISVMLPPMAIFFPLFTLLEDVGYLPRVAYNLDRPFQCCNACGKQSLTMCMGFGCNAAGVVGCRIIDSPRERLLAILTNSFVPCNGRFPALIAILTLFFVGTQGGLGASALSALLLTLVILFGILMTFAATKLLSATFLRGLPSSFTLELPPFRKPRVGSVILRSMLDRTLFVLGRAAAVAAPAGLIIWCMANLTVGNSSLLHLCADFLDPFAALMGLDGVILLAFLLGLPANEIVIPLITMAYLSEGTLTESASLLQMKELFVANGWTAKTAICVLLFFLLHWPCSTTLLTVKKETGSWKWTALAAALPTTMGILACMLVNFLWSV